MLNDRLLCELALLKQFKDQHEYLREYRILDDDVLTIAFRLVVRHRAYDFKAIFNRYFPNQPIEIIAKTVFPTTHKYRNGAMCLKWGQDNWNSDITLVQLLENLYDILFKENPLGKSTEKPNRGTASLLGSNLRDWDIVAFSYLIRLIDLIAKKAFFIGR